MDSQTSRTVGRRLVLSRVFLAVVVLDVAAVSAGQADEAAERLLAGAYAVDITPTDLPVIVNGGFLERTADKVYDRLYAKCLMLAGGRERVAIVVVDSCVLPRELLDEAKELASRVTGIATDRMMISATHTHSAPSAMGCLGSDADRAYAAKLPGWIAECIIGAADRLASAKIGWATVNDPEHTHCRRWIRRPDKIGLDPFGEPTVRAMMHPGPNNPDYEGPSGPVDCEVSVVSVQSVDGRPLALLANYSMHYAGAPAVSADYYGQFAERMTDLLGAREVKPPLVVMMSQGTSGDQWWGDYRKPLAKHDYHTIAEALSGIVLEAYRGIRYQESVSLRMIERKLTLGVRQPDQKRLEAARLVVAGMQGRKPKDQKEVYAREQVFLSERPSRELKLQVVRIGDLGITATPCEVFGLTGLRIKAQSPLRPTFNITLANGEEGYIPPPAQHALGGYTTWPARTAQLEVDAEPKIVEALLSMLEEVGGRSRRAVDQRPDPSDARAQAVLASKPAAWWPMSEFDGPTAADISGRNHHATYKGGFSFYLEGPVFEARSTNGPSNPCVHFAGGQMTARVKGIADRYTLEMWFCNYMPADGRATTGHLFCRLGKEAGGKAVELLSIGGTGGASGRLVFRGGEGGSQAVSGRTEIEARTWNHVVMVRDGSTVNVYLNGRAVPDIATRITAAPATGEEIMIGASPGDHDSFEGRIDEVVLYDRVLSVDELRQHWREPVRPPESEGSR